VAPPSSWRPVADAAAFYSALVAGNVKGVAEEVVIQLLTLLSE
jgi:hypothetical protein